MENNTVDIIGAGLAGTEAALQLAQRGIAVRLFEMRPLVQTDVHRSGNAAELVCSNSLKSTKPDSAAGMLKHELSCLGSNLISFANETRVAAGGALAVDRDLFSQRATDALEEHPLITRVCARRCCHCCFGAPDLRQAGCLYAEADWAGPSCIL